MFVQVAPMELQSQREAQPQPHMWNCLACGSQALREQVPFRTTSSSGR